MSSLKKQQIEQNSSARYYAQNIYTVAYFKLYVYFFLLAYCRLHKNWQQQKLHSIDFVAQFSKPISE